MKAIIEEGSPETGQKMQLLALAEGALPVHLLSALYIKSSENRLLMQRQLSRHLIGKFKLIGTQCGNSWNLNSFMIWGSFQNCQKFIFCQISETVEINQIVISKCFTQNLIDILVDENMH